MVFKQKGFVVRLFYFCFVALFFVSCTKGKQDWQQMLTEAEESLIEETQAPDKKRIRPMRW